MRKALAVLSIIFCFLFYVFSFVAVVSAPLEGYGVSIEWSMFLAQIAVTVAAVYGIRELV
jgi:hypothetical protein